MGVQNNIHPPFKMEIGYRLAAMALAHDFHNKNPYCGPAFKSLKHKNNTLIVEFNNLEGGLVVHGNQLREFELAGNDGKFYPADAHIVKNKVIVSSSSLSEPVAIRYCWHNGSKASLFNKAGFPATLFSAKITK
jgi:sialate O-acetylesterase